MGPENVAELRDSSRLSPDDFLYLVKAQLRLSWLMYISVP